MTTYSTRRRTSVLLLVWLRVFLANFSEASECNQYLENVINGAVTKKSNRGTLKLNPETKNKLKNCGFAWLDVQMKALEMNIELTIEQPHKADDLVPLPPLLGSQGCVELDENMKLVFRLASDTADIVNNDPKVKNPIVEDEPLINALYKSLSDVGKQEAFKSIDELKAKVNRGQYYFDKIKQDPVSILSKIRDEPDQTTRKKLSEEIVSSMMWYLQAKSGQKKLVLNPSTWDWERQFVAGGTYRFKDRGGNIFNFLTQLERAYSRMSSHYKEETKSDALILTHKGFDMDHPDQYPLPGKSGTKTVLFGNLDNGEIFLKAETNSTNIKDASKFGQVLNHTFGFVGHMSKELSSKTRDEVYAHRETIPKSIQKAFKAITKADESGEKVKKAKLSDMIKVLKRKSEGAEDPLNRSKAKVLLHVITEYLTQICGSKNVKDIEVKGCEAILNFSQGES